MMITGRSDALVEISIVSGLSEIQRSSQRAKKISLPPFLNSVVTTELKRQDSHSRRTSFILVSIVSLLLLAAFEAAAQNTYYVGESTDYPGGACSPGDGNTANSTTRFVGRLKAEGWTGFKTPNSEQNLPQAFVDACMTPGGEDYWRADSATLAVFSGHGHIGQIGFSDTGRNGMCVGKLGWAHPDPGWREGTIRLGSMDGARAGYAIWASSCTMHMSASNIATLGWQWVHQQLGFHDSPGTGNNSLTRWWDNLRYRNNAAAWLEKMQYSDFGCRVWSPVAMSFGPTEHWCWAVFNNANLKYGTYRYPRGEGPACGATEQPPFWYCWEMRNRQEECD